MIGSELVHSADSASYVYKYVSGIGNVWERQSPIHRNLPNAVYDSIISGVHFVRPTIADNSINIFKKDILIEYNAAQGRYEKQLSWRDFGASPALADNQPPLQAASRR